MFFFTRRKETILDIFFHNLLFMMYLSVLFRTQFCMGWEGIFKGGWVLGEDTGNQHFYEVSLFAPTLYCSEMANAI